MTKDDIKKIEAFADWLREQGSGNDVNVFLDSPELLLNSRGAIKKKYHVSIIDSGRMTTVHYPSYPDTALTYFVKNDQNASV